MTAVLLLVLIGAGADAGRSSGERTFAGKRMILDEDQLWTTPGYADRTLKRIKEAGFTAYSPNIWHGRGATWPTAIAPKDPLLKNVSMIGGDPLAALIRRAHGMGLEVHVWFNIVLRQADLRPEFALTGKDVGGNGAFDVHNAQFREWISDVVAEVAAKYEVDGIVLDYVRAVMLCTSDACIREYQATYGRDLRADVLIMKVAPGQVPTLIRFQEDAVTSLVRMISEKVRAVNPTVLLSADAFPGVAIPQDGQNSIDWVNRGLIDVLFRMDYFLNIDVPLTETLRKQLRRPDALSIVISNISNEERRPDQPFFPRSGRWVADTISMIERRWPNTGSAIYFYKSLTDEQIAALVVGPFSQDAVPVTR